MNKGNGNRVVRDIESIPKLKKQVCNLSKVIEDLSYVQNITDFRLNGLNLEIEFVDSDNNTQVLSENISSLSESEIKNNVLNYNELLTISSPELYQFAYVRESQGTEWQSAVGIGKYYGSGLYMWNGTKWVEDDTGVFTQLEALIQAIANEVSDRQTADANLQSQIDSNDTDISQLQNDLSQEITTRQVADTAITQALNQETTDRQNADTAIIQGLNQEITDRTNADANLQNQITDNDTDITNLQNDKRDNTAQKNSIKDDGGDLQLVGDEDNPGATKVYGTNAAGIKGWYDQAVGGDQVFVNESVMYKAFSDNSPSINILTTYQTLAYKPAVAGTFDNTTFAPVANGVQLLKDLVNVTIMGSHYVVATNGTRISLGTAIALDGVPSNVEGGGYIRVASGHNEDPFGITETFPTLTAGTVITVVGKRNAGASTSAAGVEDKAFLSVFGFIPDTPGVVLGFPAPIITSISLT